MAPRRILLADHHTERLPDVKSRLEALGHSVFSSDDALSSLEAVREKRPDLVILAPLSRHADGPEVGSLLSAKDRIQFTALLLVLEDAPKADALLGLAGRVDDVVLRDELTADRLFDRAVLALGRLGRVRRLEDEKAALERQSVTDFKTGTFNDRYFHRRLREEFARARRHRQAISCVMLDFDNFKEINDNFDHAFGDFVLLAFAKKLRAVIRDIDIPARLGGDEFALLLPSTGLDQAVRIAERIRRIVGEYLFEHDGSSTTVSLSIGISTFDGIEESSPEEFLRRADAALLEAKRRGRNRVVLYPQIAGNSGAGGAGGANPSDD
ncbi:MAG: diguanylate cyclase [Planctomycetes bacterium]|nr:diguanylate cyclase [Planctomycetota bacterium]